MYKGKYEQKQPAAAAKPPKVSASKVQPASAEETKHPAPVAEKPRPAPAAKTSQPAPQGKAPAQRKRKKRTTKGTYIFYGILLTLILVFFIVIAVAMGALKDWLINFQAAQPDTASKQVFSELFADPDWAELYDLANPDTNCDDSKAACVKYMEHLIGDKKLAFSEDAGGLSGKKYIVYYVQDSETGVGIATFTLTADNMDAEVPNWRFGELEVFFKPNLSYNIITLPGCTVTADGKALDESHIIRAVSTKAEAYLPEGIHGYQLQEMRITGLEKRPEIIVTDAQGQPVEMTYDPETKTYTQVMPELPTISDEEYDLVLATTKAYSEYMITGKNNLPKYFDKSSKIYKTITGGMIIRQGYSSYKFDKETITDYYRYSDDLFSARINLVTQVTRPNGTIKEFEVDSTLFFERSAGKWRVRDMVNVDTQEQTTIVRLTFKDDQGNILSSELVDANTKNLTTPAITAPDGKTFIGWYEETIDELGGISLAKRFSPDADGNVHLTDALTSMILVPQYEEVG